MREMSEGYLVELSDNTFVLVSKGFYEENKGGYYLREALSVIKSLDFSQLLEENDWLEVWS